jgi:WD40 repeat protein
MLYNAFLSYSHAADNRLAPALQTGLQQFAKPWNRLRAVRIFRDKTGLSVTPGLWSSIEEALDSSDYFLLLASPGSAQSHWVQKEVEHWLSRRPAKNLLVLLTDGEIAWDSRTNDFDWNITNALPRSIGGKFTEEPLWVDARWAKNSQELYLRNPAFRDVVGDISSVLRGIAKDELTGEDVRQHQKAVRLRRSAIAGLMVLALALGVAAFVALAQKTLAQQNAELAYQNEQQALANAETARVNEETAKLNEQKANKNAEEALKNKEEAEKNLELAKQNEQRAIKNQRRAEENAAEARRQSERALARQLAAQSEFVREQRAELPRATLLAVEAVRRYPSAEADQSLRRAMEILPRSNRQIELGDSVAHAAFDISGRILFIRSERKAQVWDIEDGRRLASIESPKKITAMARTRDGQRLALANDCTVTVYDAKTGREIATKSLTQNVEPFSVPGCTQIRVMDFSPDDRLIAAAGDSLVTRVWNIETGEVRDLRHGRAAAASSVKAVAFKPDGKLLASVRTGDVAVWNTSDWTRTDMSGSPPFSSDEVVAFSPERGELLAAVTGYGVAVWQNGKENRTTVMGLPGDNFSRNVALAFNGEAPDGLNKVFEGDLVAASVGGIAVVWDLSDSRMGVGKEIARVGHQSAISSLSFSPDTKRLLTVSEDKTVSLWETHGGREIARLVHDASVRAAAFRKDGRVWTVDTSGIAREWEMPADSSPSNVVKGKPLQISNDGNLLAVSEGFAGGLTKVWDLRERAKSPDAKPLGRFMTVWSGPRQFLAARSENGGVRVDDLAEGKRVLFLSGDQINENEPGSTVGDPFFSIDGRYFVINGLAWELASGRKLKPTGPGETAIGLFISPDGRRAAVRVSSEKIRVVEIESGRVLALLSVSDFDNRIELAFSPNGRYLAKNDSPVRIWDLGGRSGAVELLNDESLQLRGEGFTSDSNNFLAKRGFDDVVSFDLATRQTTELKHDSYAIVSLSPTEPLVAIAWGNTVRLWDPRTRMDLGRLEHFDVSVATFSDDGLHLATGGHSGLVRVWEVASRRENARVEYGGRVQSILFSADGRHIVAEATQPGLVDGDSFVSLLGSEDPARVACSRVKRPLTPQEWRQYLGDVPYRETCSH